MLHRISQGVNQARLVRRWYPTLLTLTTGNLLIVGGSTVTSGEGNPYTINPTSQLYYPGSSALSYNTLFPTTILTDQVPYSLYPLMWLLPHSGSMLVRLTHAHPAWRTLLVYG